MRIALRLNVTAPHQPSLSATTVCSLQFPTLEGDQVNQHEEKVILKALPIGATRPKCVQSVDPAKYRPSSEIHFFDYLPASYTRRKMMGMGNANKDWLVKIYKQLMNSRHLIILASVIATCASAQDPSLTVDETVTEISPGVVERTRTETIRTDPAATPERVAAQHRLDAALARERLGIAPIVLPADPKIIETTTTTVETPGLPPRTYVRERNVVIVQGRELPYLTIPVLFVEGSAKLLDEESRVAIADTAAAIKDVLISNPTAVFDVEGHTSTDGSDEMNMSLSADRSRAIYQELIGNYGIPTSALAAHGYGENFPMYPDGTEQQMIQDRRVLVVRVK